MKPTIGTTEAKYLCHAGPRMCVSPVATEPVRMLYRTSRGIQC